jgi:hypothetical protein
MVAFTCNPSHLRGKDQEKCGYRQALGKSIRPNLKNKKAKITGSGVHMVQHLPHKHKVEFKP